MEPITRQEIFLANAAGESTQELKPITRLEHFLKNVADHVKSIGNGGGGTGGGGAQPDWNANEGEAGHVLNRTHYVEKPFDSITWNGDITGKEEIVYNQNKSYYKVSDRILSVDDLLGAICKNNNGNSVTITEKNIMQPNENIIFLKLIGDIFVLSPTTYDGMTFNSSGVYIQKNVYGDYVSYTTEIIARDVVHKLEEKYIPDSIAKVGTAEVGQTIVVKSVDENGKPTEWECKDYSGNDNSPVVIQINGEVEGYVGADDFSGIIYDQQTIKNIKSAIINDETVSVVVKNRVGEYYELELRQYPVSMVYYYAGDDEMSITFSISNTTDCTIIFKDEVIRNVFTS